MLLARKVSLEIRDLLALRVRRDRRVKLACKAFRVILDPLGLLALSDLLVRRESRV